MALLIPIYIRALHGHSSIDRTLPIPFEQGWQVTARHTSYVYHSGKSRTLDSIIRCGLLPGGALKEQRRCQLFFSAKDPRDHESFCAGRPARVNVTPLLKVTLMTWPPSPDDDAVFVIEVRRCKDMGILFKQNSTGAVTCSQSIPPECISEVTTMDGRQILYHNKDLDAPGDRRAILEVGTVMQRSTSFIPVGTNMKKWPEKILKTKEAIKEEAYYKNYDKNFNDEQMCKKCKGFLFKGITFCVRCKTVVADSDNPNEWTELRNKERIDFANASLSELLWKSNVHCRSLRKHYGEKLKKAKGMEIFNRSVKKGVKTIVDGEKQTKRWKSCEERWKTDTTFRRRMTEINGYSLDDMRQFDAWGNQPKKPEIKMSKQERQTRFKDSRWKLAQANLGGSDTLTTSLYPQQYREEATAKARSQKVVLKESAQWHEERKQPPWRDSSWKETPWKESSWKNEGVWAEDWQAEEPKYTPSSSSTSWQQSSKPPPWRKEESQQKRRKP